MARGYIVRRSHFVRGIHISPENQHLVGSILTQEELDERVASGALEVSDSPDPEPTDEATASPRGRRRQTEE